MTIARSTTGATRRPVVIGGTALLIGLSALASACGNGASSSPAAESRLGAYVRP